MVILGIDPGTRRVGYGAIKNSDRKLEFIDAGILAIKSGDDFGALKETWTQITALLEKFRPNVLAIEKLFFMKNQKTAMRVAETRGAMLLSALQKNIEVREYAPNEVKTAVTGYGLADKKSVLKMVKLFLGKPDLDIIDDASDALALAIAASQNIGG